MTQLHGAVVLHYTEGKGPRWRTANSIFHLRIVPHMTAECQQFRIFTVHAAWQEKKFDRAVHRVKIDLVHQKLIQLVTSL
jgi:hypothetical protein